MLCTHTEVLLTWFKPLVSAISSNDLRSLSFQLIPFCFACAVLAVGLGDFWLGFFLRCTCVAFACIGKSRSRLVNLIILGGSVLISIYPNRGLYSVHHHLYWAHLGHPRGSLAELVSCVHEVFGVVSNLQAKQDTVRRHNFRLNFALVAEIQTECLCFCEACRALTRESLC